MQLACVQTLLSVARGVSCMNFILEHIASRAEIIGNPERGSLDSGCLFYGKKYASIFSGIGYNHLFPKSKHLYDLSSL